MSASFKKFTALFVAAITGVTSLAIAGGTASAGTEAPVVDTSATTVSADALPTVQIDGVVWSQAVIGDTVYAGGDFDNARPAGAAPGQNLTPRSNLLAYDITTGELINSFDPVLNGQVLSVAASPDGTRIYVAGEFTTVDGQQRRRVAALSATTGELISSFAPVGVTSQARAVVATNDTVFVGGSFVGAGSTSRNNLAAFRVSDGALVNWAPVPDRPVWALTASDDGTAVFVGGLFTEIDAQPAYGLGKIDAVTGALLPWAATETVRNGGDAAGMTSLRTHEGFVYGTTFHFGPGGNLEGNFKAPVDTGEVEWVTNCFGDVYSNYVLNDIVYQVGHSHGCGDIGGGFPQTQPWPYQHLMAFTDTVGGEHLTPGEGRTNWQGYPSPSIVNWIPNLSIGTFTGQFQAGWSIDGNEDYVVVGGEFPRANGQNQQGLVRYAMRPISPQDQGPRFDDFGFVPDVRAESSTSVEVSWTAGYDRDDRTINYRVIKDSNFGNPVFETDVESNWWTRPKVGFVDTGLTPGQTYRYQLIGQDSSNNTVYGGSVFFQTPLVDEAVNAYATEVIGDGARLYWPLNEASGPEIVDAASFSDGNALSSVTFGVDGAIDSDTAVFLGNNNNARAHSQGTEWSADVLTVQGWFNTSTTSGGRLFGFSDIQTHTSGHRDRHVYMEPSGRLRFGVHTADDDTRTITSGDTYNDGEWHRVTATLGPNGMEMYVDSALVARRMDVTEGETYLGYWRLGGDDMRGWASAPTQGGTQNSRFIGSLDEFAVYPTVLTQQQIIDQYEASGRTSTVPTAPADAYGAAVYADDPDIYWRLDETTGTTAADSGRLNSPGTYRNGFTLDQPGVLAVNAATDFDGNNGFVSSDQSYDSPAPFTVEAWFNTTTGSGGKIIGFGNNPNGLSSSYDRHVFMRNNGTLTFGVWTGFQNTIDTPLSYNDGEWHHVVATQSDAGMELYVDGVLIGTDPQTNAQSYSGHWKVGGDRTWGSASPYFDGLIDEVAIYGKVLPAERVAEHALLGGIVPNEAPTATFTSTVVDHDVDFDASSSTDADGTIVSYEWDFGDGATATGPVVQHTYAAAGPVDVTLTVTDDDGAVTTLTQSITAPEPNAAPLASLVISGEDLTVDVDAAASTDADGSIVSYAWDFGDGQTATGATASNTYAAAGTYTVTLTVVDDDGAEGEILEEVTVPFPNLEPVASFTFSTADLSVSVDASGSSDPDGTVAGYAWDFGDGATATGVTATHDYAIAGTYTVTLTVTDDDGATNASTSDVTVVAGNVAPTAAFTFTVDDLDVAFDASTSTDADGTIVSYTWDFGDGSPTATGVTAAHTYAASGSYTVMLTIEDDDAATDDETVVVTVIANEAPTAAFTSSSIDLDASFDASGSTDADGTIVSYAWNFGDTATATGATAAHTYAAAGDYDVTLTVTDDDGATSTVTTTITVVAANQSPTATFTFSSNDLVASFDATASSDPDGTIDSYTWDFGDGSAPATGVTATHTYAIAGTYTVTLTVVDDDGADASANELVPIATNAAPTADFTTTATDLDVDFDASPSADADGTVVSYAWDFGDGGTATTIDPTHTYAAAGDFTVTLTVTDDDGATGTTTRVVTVTAPNLAPTAAFSATSVDLVGSFDGSASSDPDGSITTYAWDFGDGSPIETGAASTTTHTFGSAGTYTVTLTVTDDEGATANTNQTVVITDGATATVAADAFERAVSDGLGNADIGGAWSTRTAASNFAVGGGVATFSSAPSSGPRAFLDDVEATDVDAVVSVSFDKAATGGGTYTSLFVRGDGRTGYLAKARFQAGATTLFLTRNGGAGTTTLGSATIPGYVYQVGDVVNIRLRADGDSAATVQAKLWVDGQPEPGWTIEVTDPNALSAGPVGVINYVSGSATNGVVTATFDDFSVAANGNADPVASLSSSANGLDASFDASASTDPDGSIVSYAWNFGDGMTGTGQSVVHTYATAGTYTVELTVTDNAGATAMATDTVTVPAINAPPVASFTSSANGLDASFDGSASSDPDGSIATYSWDFGDGSTGTGVAPTHTYAIAGTFDVTLTVTDVGGAVDSTTESITVTTIALIAADSFERTVASGLGTADIGGAWSNNSVASNFAVANGDARFSSGPGSTRRGTLGVVADDVDAAVTVSFDTLPSGGGYYTSLATRYNGGDRYELKVRFAAGSTTLYLLRLSGGSFDVLDTTTVPGYSYALGDDVKLRLRSDGSGTALVQAKLWLASDAEPAGWDMQVTDANALPPGGITVQNYVSGSATPGTAVAMFDDLVVSPSSP